MTVSSESAEPLTMLEVLPLLGGQLGVQGQLGHAEDAVHGRADLVAHVGQELALGAVGGLGGLLALAQRLVDPLELGHGPRELLGALRQGVGDPPLLLHLLAEPLGLPASLLLGQGALVLAPLGLAELLRLPLHLLGLLEEVDEHGDLRLEDLGHDRLGQEVDRADGIAAEDLGVAAVEGRQEDDRGVLRPVAPADQGRRSRTRPCPASGRRAG